MLAVQYCEISPWSLAVFWFHHEILDTQEDSSVNREAGDTIYTSNHPAFETICLFPEVSKLNEKQMSDNRCAKHEGCKGCGIAKKGWSLEEGRDSRTTRHAWKSSPVEM